MSCLHMVHTFHLAGFPKGLISAVTGKGSDIGDFLTMHPGINCIRLFSSLCMQTMFFEFKKKFLEIVFKLTNKLLTPP